MLKKKLLRGTQSTGKWIFRARMQKPGLLKQGDVDAEQMKGAYCDESKSGRTTWGSGSLCPSLPALHPSQLETFPDTSHHLRILT